MPIIPIYLSETNKRSSPYFFMPLKFSLFTIEVIIPVDFLLLYSSWWFLSLRSSTELTLGLPIYVIWVPIIVCPLSLFQLYKHMIPFVRGGSVCFIWSVLWFFQLLINREVPYPLLSVWTVIFILLSFLDTCLLPWKFSSSCYSNIFLIWMCGSVEPPGQ